MFLAKYWQRQTCDDFIWNYDVDMCAQPIANVDAGDVRQDRAQFGAFDAQSEVVVG